MKDNSRLKHILERAWEEVQQSPTHHLSLMTRLSIYDLLLEVPDGTLFDLIVRQHGHRLPDAGGIKVYQLLGLLTASHVLPVWEHDMEKLIRTSPEFEAYGEIKLPYNILSSAYMIFNGHALSQVEEMLAKTDEIVGSTGGFYTAYSNLSEELWYSQSRVIAAAYYAFIAIEMSVTPFLFGPLQVGKDDPNDENTISHFDVAYNSCEAYCTEDPNPPGWEKSLNLPIKRDSSKALEFWQWWLFEAIPKAQRLDVSDLSVLDSP